MWVELQETLCGCLGACNIAELAESYLQTQSAETKVNSRHKINLRKMAKMDPSFPALML
jgi:hypothetical protein